MKRLVIAVDCDDVLVATTPYFVNAYNKAYGANVSLSDAHDVSEHLWNAPRELQLERLDALSKTEEYRKLGPVQDEVKILTELSKSHTLHLVTARKQEELELTKAMLDRDLPEVFASLNFVGWGGSKGEVCKRVGADVLIDDSARHLHDAIREGLPKTGAILFGDYAWNEADSAHEDLTHCYDWVAVKNVIDTIAEAQ